MKCWKVQVQTPQRDSYPWAICAIVLPHGPLSHWGPSQISPCLTPNPAWQFRFSWSFRGFFSFLFKKKNLWNHSVAFCSTLLPGPNLMENHTLKQAPTCSPPPHPLWAGKKNKGKLKMEGKFPEGHHIAKGDCTTIPDAGTRLGPVHSQRMGPCGEQEKRSVWDQRHGCRSQRCHLLLWLWDDLWIRYGGACGAWLLLAWCLAHKVINNCLSMSGRTNDVSVS